MVYQDFEEYHINRRGNIKKQKINNYFQSFTTVDVQPLPRSSENVTVGMQPLTELKIGKTIF